MTQPSFWEQDSFLQPYDLIVVGAGIVGLSSALFYKRSYPIDRVLVLERASHPLGASTRNAGFACIGSIGEHRADLQKTSEENIKARIVRRYRGLELLKQTLGKKSIGYEHCGGYEFFSSQKKFEEVASEIDRFNDWMNDLLGEQVVYEAQELEGYPVIYNRLEGALHPGKMMQQLIRKVNEAGVEIWWNTSVQKVTKSGEVKLSDGTKLKGHNVLLAVNGFMRTLLPDIEITPARGLVFVTDEQEQMPWKGTFHHDRGYIYFRNIGKRLLIGGARNLAVEEEETDQFGINKKIRDSLKEFVSGVLRLSVGWSIEHEWSGIMGFVKSKTPIVKQVDEHRFVAAGLSGMGIAIGMEVGKGAAEMLSTNRQIT